MKVKLYDKTEITVSNSQALQIENMLLSNETEYIKIGNSTIKKTAVMGIVEGGITAADIPNFNHSVLPFGKRCTGLNSIQSEINSIIKDEHPKDWSKAIRDNQERERIRLSLREKSDDWCDYRASECVC